MNLHPSRTRTTDDRWVLAAIVFAFLLITTTPVYFRRYLASEAEHSKDMSIILTNGEMEVHLITTGNFGILFFRRCCRHSLKSDDSLKPSIHPFSNFVQTGAVIQNLLVPDRHGLLADVVLGFTEHEPYKDGTSPYFGAVVGRVANRIAGATFDLNGETYKLAANNGPNCLHGGIFGFSRVQWTVAAQGSNDQGEFVKFTYTSKDGEEVNI